MNVQNGFATRTGAILVAPLSPESVYASPGAKKPVAIMIKDIEQYVVDVAEHFRSKLGSALKEAYKLGSLAHGGFSEVYSDIDVGLLLDCPEPPNPMSDLIREVKVKHRDYGKKLSIFWGHPNCSWGRLPVLDGLDLLDHGVPLLYGHKAGFRRPTAEAIHQEQLQSIERSWRSRLPELSRLARLEIKDRKPYIRAILYPARLIYTWDNLAVASNDRAVEYLHGVGVPGMDLEAIDMALACRRGACAAEELFALAPDFNVLCDSALRYIGATR